MKTYKVLIERTMFYATLVHAHDEADAKDQAWEWARVVSIMQPQSETLGEVGVHSVEEVK